MCVMRSGGVHILVTKIKYFSTSKVYSNSFGYCPIVCIRYTRVTFKNVRPTCGEIRHPAGILSCVSDKVRKMGGVEGDECFFFNPPMILVGLGDKGFI